MTIKDLKKCIDGFPDDMPVCIVDQIDGDIKNLSSGYTIHNTFMHTEPNRRYWASEIELAISLPDVSYLNEDGDDVKGNIFAIFA